MGSAIRLFRELCCYKPCIELCCYKPCIHCLGDSGDTRRLFVTGISVFGSRCCSQLLFLSLPLIYLLCVLYMRIYIIPCDTKDPNVSKENIEEYFGSIATVGLCWHFAGLVSSFTATLQVSDVYMPIDKYTQKPRGLAFVTFVDEAGCALLITTRHFLESILFVCTLDEHTFTCYGRIPS